MKVFISWSGERSKAVAKVLRRRLGNIIQAVDPYMSDQDIDKGVRWFDDVSSGCCGKGAIGEWESGGISDVKDGWREERTSVISKYGSL
jgi:hypothetical protein